MNRTEDAKVRDPAQDDPRVVQALEEYLAALEAGPRPDRQAFLARHGEIAAALGRALDGLEFIRTAAPQFPGPGADEGAEVRPEGPLGDFRIVREIGRGGMGVVYEAVQISLGRRVALKVLPFAATLDGRQLQRFQNEARAAAQLHHANIVPVYGVGQERGVHYYAMQFIDGQTLAALLHQLRQRAGREAAAQGGTPGLLSELVHDLAAGHWTPPPSGAPPDQPTASFSLSAPAPAAGASTEQAIKDTAFFRLVARLGVQVAEALEHAHAQGIVHRDVKPANLLVDGAGNLWVTDFGLAHCQNQAGLTMTGDLVGTLRYMSPEQALGKRVAIDHRTDLYSLGVTLYELLTLEPAFAGSGRQELLRQIAFEEPRRPRRLNRAIPAELEAVVLKAMEKNPADRYASARELADDLGRFLEDKPIRAQPPTFVQRARKWARRHPEAVVTAAAAAVVLLASVAVLSVLAAVWLRDERNATLDQLQKTQQAQREGRYQLYKAKLAQAQARRWSGRVGQRFESLQAVAEASEIARQLRLDESHTLELRNEAIACLALADVRLVGEEWPGFPPGSEGPLAFAADLERYARGDSQGTLSVRRVAGDQELARLPGPGKNAGNLWFSPDGGLLAVEYNPLPGRPTNFAVWDWQRRAKVFEPPFPVSRSSAAFSPDGRHLALGQAGGKVRVYEVGTWKGVKGLAVGFRPGLLAFHPDGTRLAVGSSPFQGPPQLQVRDLATGRLLHQLSHPEGVWEVAWHPGGNLLAAACYDSNVYLWDAATGRQHAVLRGHQGSAVGVAFDPGGHLLLSRGWDGTGRLWDPWTGRQLLSFPGAASGFSGDGRRLVCRQGSQLGIWQVNPGPEFRTLPNPGGAPYLGDGGVSPDGRWLVVGGGHGVGLWDLAAGKQRAFLPLGGTEAAVFHPSGREFVTGGSAGLYRWPIRVESGTLRVGPPRKLAAGPFQRVALDRGGHVLAAVGNHRALIVNLDGPPEEARGCPHVNAVYVATSPDGRWVASGTFHGFGVKVWEAASGRLVRDLLPAERVARVAFSPDGRWLATSTEDEVRLWEAGTWRFARQIRQEAGGGYLALAFAADGKVLALATARDRVRLEDPVTGRLVADLQAPTSDPVQWLGFSPDGSQLALAATLRKDHGLIRVWDLRQIRAQLQALGLDWDLAPYPPRPDGEDSQPLPVRVDLGEFAPFQAHDDPRRQVGLNSFVLALNPYNFQAYLRRGQAHARLGELERAAADYRTALTWMPAPNRLCAARFAARAADPEALREYVRTLADALRDVEGDPLKANNRAWHHATGPAEARDPVLALAFGERALAKKPDDACVLNTVGLVYYRLGWYEQARALLRRSLQLQCAPAHDLFFLAMCAARRGDRAEARECYDRAIAWVEQHRGRLPADWSQELDAFRAEAAELLGVKEPRALK
jgi:serine/threonine protein kinase/WD40 repeat protein/tetratricopeptide (TPR) repeat protein